MLVYDQISQGRRTILDYGARLDDDLHELALALAQWAARDDTKAESEVTRAGDAAVAKIDAMLAELHALRSRLIGEIRADQDIAVARADAMLAALHS